MDDRKKDTSADSHEWLMWLGVGLFVVGATVHLICGILLLR